MVKQLILKLSENVYIKKLDIEAKRTRWIVRKFISKQSEYVYIKEFNDRSEAK
jgi:hypothetical protein